MKNNILLGDFIKEPDYIHPEHGKMFMIIFTLAFCGSMSLICGTLLLASLVINKLVELKIID